MEEKLLHVVEDGIVFDPKEAKEDREEKRGL